MGNLDLRMMERYPTPQDELCKDRVLDGPDSGEKGSKGGPYMNCNPCIQDPVLTNVRYPIPGKQGERGALVGVDGATR